MSSQETEVMIVEDEAIISLALSRHLGEFGYRVTDIVHSGEEAIRRCLSSSPDIVLMDIVLKGKIDGITAAQQIRSEKHIPIIFLTAYSDTETVDRAAATAPSGYVTKPYDPREIRAVIESALSKAVLERALIDSEYWHASLLRSAGDAIIATDSEQNICYMNPVAERMTEISLDQARNQKFGEVVKLESPSRKAIDRNLVADALHKLETQNLQFGSIIVSISGSRTAVDDSVSPIVGDDGKLLGAVMVLHDVTREVELRKSVQAGEQRFHNVFMQSAIGCMLIEFDDSLRQVNRAVASMLGYSVSELKRMDLSTLLHGEYHEREFELRNAMIDGKLQTFSEEWRYRHRVDGEFWGLTCGALVRNDFGEPEYLVYQVTDISERKRLESRLLTMANYDSLTGLVNRARLQIEIQRAISGGRRYHRKFGLVFIDLDNFKHINDSLGHHSGDTLLKEIGKRLASMARATDITARLGGDEFVVLVSEIEDPGAIVTVAEKLQAIVAAPIMIDEREIHTSTSIGISVYPEDGDDANTLLRNADSALYKAKEKGRGSIAFYSANLTAQSRRRLELENGLRKALELREFFVEYQPIVDLGSGEPICFEALLRWRRGDEVVLPDAFIEIAEQTGLIVPIGEWVLREALHQAALWGKIGPQRYAVSVNVSVRQVREQRFADFVSDTLAQSGLEPENLWIEITESLLIDVEGGEYDGIEALRKLGVAIAVDDFGVGYSSLSYLKHLAPYTLKIDRGFVADIDSDSSDRAIVSAIVAMAQKLGMRVVAEGIENERQLEILEAEGCSAGQGRFFLKPVSGNDLLQFLGEGTPSFR